MPDSIPAHVLLRSLVERRFEKNQAFAAEWLDRWNHRSKRKLTLDTAESRVCNVLADHEDGWAFFFKDPARSSILFDLLDPSGPERASIEAAAADRLAGRRHVRICVDLHDIAGDADALLAAVEDGILAVPGATPALVLLTPDQYRRLPITYADRRDELELVKVADAAEAAAGAARCPGALVVAATPPRDGEGTPVLARWAALQFTRKQLDIEPADAVSTFLRDGALDELPVVLPAHRLDALAGLEPGVVPAGAADSGLVGPALRRRLVELAAGTAAGTAQQRLADAHAWGIIAASTDDERVHDALQRAGLSETTLTREELDRAIERAGRRPGKGVYACDDRWHLLNVEPPAALVGHPRVEVHRVEAGPTALRRLHDAVSGRTALEMAEDPRLDAAVATLDREGREREAFAYARAWLLHGGLTLAPARDCADPMPRLERLLAGEPPPAEVLVRVAPGGPRASQGKPDKPVPTMFVLPDPAVLTASVWEQVPPAGEEAWVRRDRAWVAMWAGERQKIGDWCWSQGGPSARSGASYWTAEAHPSAWQGPILIGRSALPAAIPIDEDAWLDAFESRGPASPGANLKARFDGVRSDALETLVAAIRRRPGRQAGSAREAAESALHSQYESGRTGHDIPYVEASVAPFPTPDWAELDLHLALAWLALRQAFATRRPLRLHDGRHVLPLRPGLLAEITTEEAPSGVRHAGPARSCTFGQAPSSLWDRWTLKCQATEASLDVMLSPCLVTLATGLAPGALVPAELCLIGEGVAATIRFLAEPYDLAAGPPPHR